MVRFDSVIADSRCPEDVVCIQAGSATILLGVFYQAGPDILYGVRLATRPDSSTALVAGYFVDLVDLLPHPRASDPPSPDTRRVRLVLRPALD